MKLLRFLRYVFICLIAAATVKATPADETRKEIVEALQVVDVLPNRQSVEIFLKKVESGSFGVLEDSQAVALIQQLGHQRYQSRVAAEERLKSVLNPPQKLLLRAADHSDVEISVRAQRILAALRTRPDPRIAVFWLIKNEKIRVDLDLLLKAILKSTNSQMARAGQGALAAIANRDDLPQLRSWAESEDERVQGGAILALAKVLGKEAIAELLLILDGADAAAQSAAALALVELKADIDWPKYEKLLDKESLAKVIHFREANFRQMHRADRDNVDVMNAYSQLLERYIEVVGSSEGVFREERKPTNSTHWFLQGLDTSKHPEVLAYRIRWFNGKYSSWMVPGYNDREKEKSRDIRLWSNFNDHPHEVVYTTDRSKYRLILDLP
ncbi:MAG: hypothetical protein ACI9G1_005515 [Pirellulaceae bacterium]|jgi:hypothetical protein